VEFYVYVDYWFNELALSKSNSFISLAQSRYQKITSRHYISETLNNNHSRIPSMNNGNTYQECKHRLYCLWCSHLKQFISYIFLVFLLGFTTTCSIKVVSSRLCQGVLYTSLCDKVCQWVSTGRWFTPDTPLSSTNKTDHHNIAKIVVFPYHRRVSI
jgi:hypothetical protein